MSTEADMSIAGGEARVERLRQAVRDLAPWHMEVQITEEVKTVPPEAAGGEKLSRRVSFVNPREPWLRLIQSIYPQGLAGKSMLETACNCGAYCFWAKELGAERTFGFDIRDHWIDQAKFIQAERTVGPTEGMTFDTMDVYDLPKRMLEPFDIVMFQGIFYHLPDPITALKYAADLCSEVLLLDTATYNHAEDNMLVCATEGVDHIMSGVHGLNWFPTGPKVLERILLYMGFVETRTIHWRYRESRPKTGRLRMVASRKAGLLAKVAHTDVQTTVGGVFGPKYDAVVARKAREAQGG